MLKTFNGEHAPEDPNPLAIGMYIWHLSLTQKSYPSPMYMNMDLRLCSYAMDSGVFRKFQGGEGGWVNFSSFQNQ